MATLSPDGSLTWGSGPASRSTWNEAMTVRDPGLSLQSLPVAKHDPLTTWKVQPSLRKVVEFIARNLAMVPLNVYVRISDTDRQRAVGSPADRMLHNPAPLVTGSRLIHDLAVDWMLYDRWMVLDVDGVLRRVPARLIDVRADFLGGVTALRISTPKGAVDVTDATLAFDSGWSDAGAAGVSPLMTLTNLLDEQDRAVRWRSEQWEKAARLTGILTKDGNVMQPQNRARLLEGWAEFTRSKAGGTPLLEDGVKFEKVEGVRPSDTQDLEGRRLTDSEVASAYHVPPELVGARQGTFSNIAAFRQMLFGPTLGPLLTRIEDAFNERIVPALADGTDQYAEFNREAAMAGSFAEQAQVLSRSTGGPWLTRNEARARQNLPAIEGADELVVPKNVTEGGLASPTDTDGTDEPEWGGQT